MKSFSFLDKQISVNLNHTEWEGTVEDISDPEKQGKCRVRVFGLFDGRTDDDDENSDFIIPTKDLPWAQPVGSAFFSGKNGGAGSMSIPKLGSIVKVRFSGGNVYAPEFFAVQDINKSMAKELESSYENSHVILYDEDEDLKVFYRPDNGFEINFKGSHFTINPDKSITIEHEGTRSIIELTGGNINITANSTVNITSNSKIEAVSSESIVNGRTTTKLGPAPAFSAVLAEPLWAFLTILAAAVDAKMPSTPGVMVSQANTFKELSSSKNVKLSP
jgi:hypothetical protein